MGSSVGAGVAVPGTSSVGSRGSRGSCGVRAGGVSSGRGVVLVEVESVLDFINGRHDCGILLKGI